jgi:hypothetical protein
LLLPVNSFRFLSLYLGSDFLSLGRPLVSLGKRDVIERRFLRSKLCGGKQSNLTEIDFLALILVRLGAFVFPTISTGAIETIILLPFKIERIKRFKTRFKIPRVLIKRYVY